jgi:hypothetical protein
MLKIPYGKSDYRTLVENNYFYQDRTMYNHLPCKAIWIHLSLIRERILNLSSSSREINWHGGNLFDTPSVF